MRISVKNPVNCWNALKPSCQSVAGNSKRNVLEKLMDGTMGNQHPSDSGMSRRFNEQSLYSRTESGSMKAGSVKPICCEFLKSKNSGKFRVCVHNNIIHPTNGEVNDTMMCSGLAPKGREDRIKSLSITKSQIAQRDYEGGC